MESFYLYMWHNDGSYLGVAYYIELIMIPDWYIGISAMILTEIRNLTMTACMEPFLQITE